MTVGYIDCNVCGSKRYTLQFIYDGQNYVRCDECGLVFINPRLSDAAYDVIYDEDYYQSVSSLSCGYDDYLGNRSEIERTGRRRFRLIRRFATPGPMLDIGCAHGFYMNAAREAGWRPVGLEISEHACRHAREHFGHEVFRGALQDYTTPSESFDLVTMWDVLEHLTNPAAHVARCARLLRPDGILSIITPDVSSLHARLLGRRWVEFRKPREHIYYFRRDNVRRLMEKNGFEVVWSGTAGKHVTVGFALKRLQESMPPFRPLIRAVEAIGLSRRVIYVNPLDKMFMLGRKI